MAMLTWDETGTRLYENGVDRGVLWVYTITEGVGKYGNGIAWTGLTGVNDNPEGGDQSELWADNLMYATMRAREKAGGQITAYTYPDEFTECDGSAALKTGIYIGQQTRKMFGFSYRNMIGNDVTDELGYKIHIYYGCTCSPSSKDYSTINDNPDAIEFSWDFEATPVAVAGYKPTAHLIIDSTKLAAEKLQLLENSLYGTAEKPSELLMPAALAALID